ncbi:MAG: NUDIX hydrolase [Acidimicrobiales bacterium]
MAPSSDLVALSLDAVIVAVTNDVPRVLVVDDPTVEASAIPSGPLDVADDATLELGMRRWIRARAGIEVGYIEQLYTFGDRGRARASATARPVSVAYLALVQETVPTAGARWADVYELLPWEDHRNGSPAALEAITPALDHWAGDDPDRRARIHLTFGDPWDGIRVLDRYELLYSAGAVAEAAVDAGLPVPDGVVGEAMFADHRRVVATALGRLRGKLTYRPLVFELLGERFTLLELQRTVEALAGVRRHKQNFRRFVERSRLVEGTGERAAAGTGRPAELFRYRPEVQLERSRPGLGQPYG